jgi:non-specific serine/threonine protein kinase/serine/threonine-protein kinase
MKDAEYRPKIDNAPEFETESDSTDVGAGPGQPGGGPGVIDAASAGSAHGNATDAPHSGKTGGISDAVTESISLEEQQNLVESRIGPYKLIREIGSGGMGSVYLAQRDDEFNKRVAIKLVKRGMDTEFIVRRFRNERQILASLDHPNIARLLDGGSIEDGRPYFVMDYIEGQPITRYCDANRLSTAERLRLFCEVCSAVHYAHQNLVIHRDIKPQNILVTADGTPKLLDFGIAKLLNPDSAAYTVDITGASVRLMTPEYASPEQVRSDPITTSTDVYSLGVLLYELLTGRRPYRITSRSPLDLLRIICEEQPDKPSTAVGRSKTETAHDGETVVVITPESVSENRDSHPEKLRRRLKGDIDNIVLMAMRKEPQRRYSSADQFASDIRRHLAGLPVSARKDTLAYRSGKFIKRNRAGVVAALLIVVALVAGAVSTMTQRAKAEHRFNDVRRLANSFMFEVHDAIADLPGSTAARELLVKRALEYLDSLADEASGDTSLQRELAAAYQKVGDVQGRPSSANLGDIDGAMQSYRKALSIWTTIAAADPKNVQDGRQLATSHSRVAEILGDKGDANGAREEYQKSFEIRERLYSADPNDPQLRRDMAVSYFEIAEVQVSLGDIEGSLENRRKMLPIFESLLAADPSNPNARRTVALSHKKLGATLARLERYDEALAEYGQALEMDQKAVVADPANAAKQMDLSFSLSDYGFVQARSGKNAAALESYRKALEIRNAVSTADPKDERARASLATTYGRIGWVLSNLGDMPAATASFREAIAIRQAMAAANPANPTHRADLGGLYGEIGDAWMRSASSSGSPPARRVHDRREARAWYQRSLDTLTELARDKGDQAVSSAFVADLKRKLAELDVN